MSEINTLTHTIKMLKQELQLKESVINSLGNKIERIEDELRHKTPGSEDITKRHHPISTITHVVQDKGVVSQARVGTRGSVMTENILQTIPEIEKTEAQFIAEKFVKVFSNPVEHMAYLQSSKFSSDLITLCMELETVLENEPRCLFLQSPVYVFGDIHGNLEDLHFFADNIWKLGMDLTAGKFLFLGK